MMRMIRLTAFIIALLLAVDALEPDAAWLITLAVLSGIAFFSAGGRRSPFPFHRLRAWVDAPWVDEDDW